MTTWLQPPYGQATTAPRGGGRAARIASLDVVQLVACRSAIRLLMMAPRQRWRPGPVRRRGSRLEGVRCGGSSKTMDAAQR